MNAEIGAGAAPAMGEDRREFFRVTESLRLVQGSPREIQTANRARPLARRARITARPLLVRMRTKNPWVR